MKYQILAVGLKRKLFSWCRTYFSRKNVELNDVLNITEVTQILEMERETVHLLVLDMEYLRSISQSDWIINIRHISFIPIIVLSDIPEVDVGPTIRAGADACYNSKLPPGVIAHLLSAQLRRYTEYNNLHELETVSFQVGDITVDPRRRFVWVCGQAVTVRPREFAMLLYFMRNPNIVLTAKQICEYAWGLEDGYKQGISHPIHLLRQAIEPDPANPIYIKTVHHVGYCFTVNNGETCEMC